MSKRITIEKFRSEGVADLFQFEATENHIYYRAHVEEMGDGTPFSRWQCGNEIAMKSIEEVNKFIEKTKEEFSHSTFQDTKWVTIKELYENSIPYEILEEGESLLDWCGRVYTIE